MSKYSHYREPSGYQSDRKYRDYYERGPKAKAKMMGVCAGVAHQFDWDVTLVRVVAVLCLFTFTVPTAIAYLVAGTLFY